MGMSILRYLFTETVNATQSMAFVLDFGIRNFWGLHRRTGRCKLYMKFIELLGFAIVLIIYPAEKEVLKDGYCLGNMCRYR